MKPLIAVVLCVAAVTLSAADKSGPKIPNGSKIYIEAPDGFDNYLMAALQKKKVPVTVTTDKAQADYLLDGVSDHQKPGWAKVVFLGQIHSDDQASIKLVNAKTGDVVFAYAVNKKNTLHGRQTAKRGDQIISRQRQ